MTFDELCEKVATEPDRTTERDVRVPSAELLAAVREGHGVPRLRRGTPPTTQGRSVATARSTLILSTERRRRSMCAVCTASTQLPSMALR
jgi:hypothetical protein